MGDIQGILSLAGHGWIALRAGEATCHNSRACERLTLTSPRRGPILESEEGSCVRDHISDLTKCGWCARLLAWTRDLHAQGLHAHTLTPMAATLRLSAGKDKRVPEPQPEKPRRRRAVSGRTPRKIRATRGYLIPLTPSASRSKPYRLHLKIICGAQPQGADRSLVQAAFFGPSASAEGRLGAT